MNKKLVTGMIALSIATMPFNVFALEKEESIYSNLNADGTRFKTVVTSHLSAIEGTTIEDTTELKKILNINGKEKFTLDNNKLTWTAKGKDIFYQGEFEKELPIETSVKYYLDGKEVTNKELIGASGKVEIEITLTNTDAHQIDGETLYTPFVVTLGAMLDKNASNITISNGKVINSGNKFILVGLATPGLYESTNLDSFKEMNKITITFDTKKYKQPTIYTVATPKLIEKNDLEVFNKLDDVYNKVGLLKTNMDAIENGANELENGAQQLLNGTKEINENLNTVKNYMQALTQGTYDLNGGVKQIIDAIDASSASLSDSNMQASLEKLSILKEKNTEAINKLTETNTTLAETYEKYQLSEKTLQEITIEEIMSLPLSDKDMLEKLVTIKNTYDGNSNLIYLLSMNNSAIDTTSKTLMETATTVKTQLSSLRAGLVELESGTNTLYTNSSKITEGINALYQGTNTLMSGTSSLVSGTTTLKSGISTYNKEGISTLVSYANTIQGKTNKLKKLVDLSEQYKGFASNNTTNATFVSVIK